MTWGTELWDQEKTIFEHIDRGIDSLASCRHMIQAHADIEAQYAKSMQKLIKQYKAEAAKDDCGGEPSSSLTAWRTVIEQLEYISKQHETRAEEMEKQVVTAMKELGNEHKTIRKTQLSALHKHQKGLNAARSVHDKHRKAHEHAIANLIDMQNKEQAGKEAGSKKIQKLEDDTRKARDADSKARDAYQMNVHEFNQVQREYYSNQQCGIFDELEQAWCERARQQISQLQVYTGILRQPMGIIGKCLDAMDLSLQAVEPETDATLFATNMRSGFAMPQDVDPTVVQQAVTPTSKMTVQQVNQRRVHKKKIFKTTSRKKDAIREDFGHLPPEQRRKAIEAKIAELSSAHQKTRKGIEATSKTIELYQSQPAFGDDKTIEKAKQEIKGLEKILETQAGELFKFQLYHCAITGDPMPPAPEGYKSEHGSTASLGVPPVDEDAVSRASVYSQQSQASTNPFAPGQAAASTDAPNPFATAGHGTEDDEEDEFDDDWSDDETANQPPAAAATAADPTPPQTQGPKVLAQATVMYDFAGTNDGEIAVTEGEVVDVTALDDDGTGWVRVLKNGQEGYCPATYVTIQDASA
eukprot:TRINITY_DN12161_c1_g4_i1.p1 TRINITY_DN12161_c1_g4~~TRINITY_DN12161_c1_g4_i1.p1  ORF type:complete len:582 (+),score=178.68 TRINITY_DN12161_c1_g4_i1:44-1789(+)